MGGFEGTITWEGASPQGTCVASACNIANSNLKPGLECACQGPFFEGSIIWKGPEASGACNLQLTVVLLVISAIVALFGLLCKLPSACRRRKRRPAPHMSQEARELSGQLLTEVGLQDYIPTFEEECITVDAMRMMSENDFNGLGLKKGHRVL